MHRAQCAAVSEGPRRAPYIRRAQMDVDGSPVGQRTQFAFENAKTRIEFQDGLRHVAGHNPIAALDPLVFQLRPGKVDGAALARPARLGCGVLRVNGAGARL